jgi:hypothetical protein
VAVPDDSISEMEAKERLNKGQCTFKAHKKDGGKWCSRLLKTKAEKSSGYCLTHMRRLGMVKAAVPGEAEASADKD